MPTTKRDKQLIKNQIDHIVLATGLLGVIIASLHNAPFEWEGILYIDWILGIIVGVFDAFKAYKLRRMVDALPEL